MSLVIGESNKFCREAHKFVGPNSSEEKYIVYSTVVVIDIESLKESCN
jgi:hypothetical protein